MDWTSIRLVPERRTLAMLMLGFCTSLFALLALALGGPWIKCMAALAVTYGVAFVALGSEWFWARWYAVGLATSGLTSALFGLLTGGLQPGLIVWGALHLLVYLPLLGASMAERYEGQASWRERYGLDPAAVLRIQRSVKGAAAALPTVIIYALAPRQQEIGTLFGPVAISTHLPLIFALVLLLIVALGFYGLIKLRFWGVAALALAAVLVAVSVLSHTELLSGVWSCSSAPRTAQPTEWQAMLGSQATIWGMGLIASLALVLAVLPFVRPAYAFLKQPFR
jgi:hypothetical protein